MNETEFWNMASQIDNEGREENRSFADPDDLPDRRDLQ